QAPVSVRGIVVEVALHVVEREAEPRQDRDAVIRPLPEMHEAVAGVADLGGWELVVLDLRLLQTHNIRTRAHEPRRELLHARADRVDVPACDSHSWAR